MCNQKFYNLFIYLFIYLYIYVSIYLFICLFINVAYDKISVTYVENSYTHAQSTLESD